MSGGTQYGELVRDAGQHILAASVELERQTFADQAAALSAATAYRDMLQALSRHGRELMGSEVRRIVTRGADDADPRDVAAARLIDHLAYIGERDLGPSRAGGEVSASWVAAASSMRAATDLLATHRYRDGGGRSPEAELLEDADVRAAGFGELAAITIPIAAAGTALGLRVGQSGVEWADVQGLVPETGPLLEIALEARRLGGLFGAPLATLGVARPAVRSGDPVVELGDRLARLHRVAWQLTREERVGACTLADFAVAGVVVHEYAARLLRHVSAPRAGEPTDLGTRRGLAHLEEASAAWRLVHLDVRQLRTTTPTLMGLRADVVAVRKLLDQLVGAACTEGTASHQLLAVVVGGTRAFGEVAHWNVQVLDDQAKRGHLLVPGRFLTGNEVSDHPSLVVAKLKGWMAPVPKDHLQPLREAYEAARTVSLGLSAGPAAPLVLPERSGPALQI